MGQSTTSSDGLSGRNHREVRAAVIVFTKSKAMKLIICALAVVFPTAIFAEWMPPANPDPDKILNEATG